MAPTLADLQRTLPNFPPPILEDWLLPYAQTAGWPPALDDISPPEGRWRYLLKIRPLGYWKSIRWTEVTKHLSIHQLEKSYQDISVQIVLGALKGQRNLYSDSIKDLPQRFNSIVTYLRENGNFPRPPVLLAEPSGLAVVDGNHRLAAYFYCYGYFKFEVSDDLLLKAKELQTYWRGEA